MNRQRWSRLLIAAVLVLAPVLMSAFDQAGTAPPVAAATGIPQNIAAGDWIQLFNGSDLTDWTIKFAKHDLGENFNDTFRVEDGLLKVRYDKWPTFNGEFGHIFYKDPFSYYLLAAEYRFVGQQVTGGPAGPSATTASCCTARSADDAEGSGLSGRRSKSSCSAVRGQGRARPPISVRRARTSCMNGQAAHRALHQFDVADLRRRSVGARRSARCTATNSCVIWWTARRCSNTRSRRSAAAA